MPAKVSVVVPVFNPGPFIDPCISSLLGQTMPADDLELIFVDDGSTDDTLARLQQLAATHPQVNVITIPNSGWPGKPRNVGIDAAHGEYVMFVDQDDRLEPQAMKRMYALGSANQADVVLGKVISDFRGVHHELYRFQRPKCTIFDAPLIHSLTPHKMLRTAFLIDQRIRYAEGRRRLEDQLFMVKAYFGAQSVSIVSDYICYRYLRRPDGKNAGFGRIDPPGYFANLAEVLDVVDLHTPPGEVRDGFYRRFLGTEMLRRLTPDFWSGKPQQYVESLITEIRHLMENRFPLTVDQGLGAARRAHAALARHGTAAEIAAYVEKLKEISAVGQVTRVRHVGRARVKLDLEIHLERGGRDLILEKGEDLRWLLPADLRHVAASDDMGEIGSPEDMRCDVTVSHRVTSDQWFLPGPMTANLQQHDNGARVTWTGSMTVDAGKLAGGRALPGGIYDLHAHVLAFGLGRGARLRAPVPTGDRLLPLLVSSRGAITRPYVTDQGNLSFTYGTKQKRLVEELESAVVRTDPDRGVFIDLGVVWATPPRLKVLIGADQALAEISLAQSHPRSSRWTAGPSRRLVATPKGEHRIRLTLADAPAGTPKVIHLSEPLIISSALRRRWLSTIIKRRVRRGLRSLTRARRAPQSR